MRGSGAVLLMGLAVAAAPADEAVLRDGRRQAGALTFTAGGRLAFVPAGAAAPLPGASVQRIVLPPAPVTPFRAGVVHQVHLPGGQRVSGELLALDDNGARLRVPWAALPLVVFRTATRGVTQPAGQLALLDEDFETLPGPWVLAGSPGLTEDGPTSGRHALVLSAGGQSAAWRPARPLMAGSVGVNVRAPDRPVPGATVVELEFSAADGPRRVRVPVAGPSERVGAEAPGTLDEGRPLPKQAGWRRLAVEFGPARLLITLDDQLLWYRRGQGAGGPLAEVRLRREGAEGPSEAVAFDELTVCRAAEPLVRPDVATGDDEAWLDSGDQVFGRLRRAARREVAFEAAGGPFPCSWANVRGVFLAPRPRPPQTSAGEHVRLTLAPAAGREPDELEGVVTALDERRLVLRHAVLGELALPRERLRSLTPHLWGRRVELETSIRHLGEAGQLLPGAGPVRAEGPEWETRFPLDAAPGPARLVLAIAARQGRTTRTEVVLNGARVADLGQHVGAKVTTPVRVELPIPSGLLQAGVNVLHVYQVPEQDGGRRESCVLGDVVLELPAPRPPAP